MSPRTCAHESHPHRVAPVGRFDTIQSSITGKLLRYFTPNPLPDLIREWGRPAKPPSRLPGENDTAIALLLMRPAAAHAPTNSYDLHQAQRFGEVIFGRLQVDSPSGLISLGTTISPKVGGLREEIVFSGGPNASQANHIFAPYGALPEQIGYFSRGIKTVPSSIDPGIGANIVGFCGAHLHPFTDGNGRWSRLLAAQSAKRVGNPAAGLLSAAFQSWCKEFLTQDIWPASRHQGLELYLDIGEQFETAALGALQASEATTAARKVLALIKSHAPSAGAYKRAAISTFLGEDPLRVAECELRISTTKLQLYSASLSCIFEKYTPHRNHYSSWMADTTSSVLTNITDMITRKCK